MKGNNGKGNIPERDLWETPQELWDKLNKQYNFFIDCCANKNNTKTKRYYQRFEECPFINDNIVCWMNPPFSKAKEMFEHFFKVVSKGVAIYRSNNMETKVWQDIILKNADWIFIPKGRVSYFLATENANGRKGSRFPSALIGKGVDTPKGFEGVILKIK